MPVFRTVSLYIDPGVCQSCRRCLAAKACRTKAIVQIDPDELPYLEEGRCRDCWACISACPNGAVKKLKNDADGK